MTRALAQTYTIAHDNRISIAYALCAGCLFLILLYAVNVYAVVSRTVAIQHAEMQTAALSARVDALDAKYLSLSRNITPDSLSSYGMTAGAVSEYIDTRTSLGRATTGGHEL